LWVVLGIGGLAGLGGGDRFIRTRRPAWAELDTLLADAKRRPERLGPDGALRLGELDRATAADVARARSAFPGDPLVRALEHRLVRRRQGFVTPSGPGLVVVAAVGFTLESVYWSLVVFAATSRRARATSP
jgi:hypothetical protein